MNHQNRRYDIFNELFGFTPGEKPQAKDALNQAVEELTDALNANTKARKAHTESYSYNTTENVFSKPATPAVDTHTYSGKRLERGFNCVFNVYHWCVLKNLHNLDPTEFRYEAQDVMLTEKAALSYAQFCEILKTQR